MEEGEVVVPKLWVHFDSKPNDKGQPSNVGTPSEKICCKKVPVINANATNLKRLHAPSTAMG